MTQPSHQEILNSLERGQAKFVEIEKQLDAIVKALEPLPQMQADIAETKEIVAAWAAVKTLGKFIKWAGGIVTALGAIVLAVKFGITGVTK